MGALLLAALLAQPLDGGLSEPPLVVSDVPIEVAPVLPPRPATPEQEPTTTVLHFAPLSLFATHLSFELEKAISPAVTVSASLGASLVPQVGGELGLRLSLSGHAFEGPFLGAQGAVLYFAPAATLLVGPGALVGYVFRPKGKIVMSVGGGVQVWFQPTVDSGVSVLGVDPKASVLFLPGFQRPGQGHWAPQPIIRFTVGPGF